MKMDSHINDNLFNSFKRTQYCNALSELDSKKPFGTKLKKFPDQEIDRDYKWFLDWKLENDKKTKHKRSKNVDQDMNHYEKESQPENDEDPQYRLFLENLVQDGKSYKLQVSKDDEPLRFIYYEQPENSDGFDDDDDDPPTYGEHANQPPQDMQVVQRDERMLHGKQGKISTMNEASKKDKIGEHKSLNWDPCYRDFFKTCRSSNSGAFLYKGNEVNYEEIDKQIVLVETCDDHLSLKEKLMDILKKPFSKREYKDLKEYVEKQKPICRHMDLRNRALSPPVGGMTKSLLDRSPGCFRRRYDSAKKEQSKAKALNLLRMLRFWLEHVPDEDIFEPWFDKEILEVLPLTLPHKEVHLISC